MAPLIDRQRREMARRALGERREALLSAAREMFAACPVGDITLQAVGRQAGVPDGTAELLFTSREQLFLEVLAGSLNACCDELLAELEDRPSLEPRELGGLLARVLARHPLLTRQLAQLAAAVESMTDTTLLWHFGNRVRQRLARVRQEIQARCPALGAARLRVLPLWLFVLASGLEPLAHAEGGLAAALVDPELRDFAVDFETEMAAMLTALLR